MRAICLVIFVLAAGPALAQRPASYAMTCDQTQALVATHGSVVLSTSPSTYDRVVAEQRFCRRDEYTEPLAAPTVDTPACVVGFRCRSRSDQQHR